MKSERGEEWVSIVSHPESSCKEHLMKHLQGVRWQESEFYLKKLRRDTIVLIPVEVHMKHRVVQGVCRLDEALEVIN